jgi:general secretion pathway protein K
MTYVQGDSSEGKTKGEKIAPWRDQRGMALLITVLTVSLLVAVTIQFHKTTWQKFLVANNYMVETQLNAIAESGVNIALAVLQSDEEENQTDSFLDGWAQLDKEKLGGLFPTGTLQLKIIDLSGRLQVNSLVQTNGENPGAGGANTEEEIRLIFQNLLLSGVFPIEDEAEARSIVDALVDWIDEDDQESDLGAESSFYQSLAKPYSCRNGPVRYMEELLLVRGISPALLFGQGDKKGLADYLTVHGDDGKVNFNTAPLLVVKSFDPSISDDLLDKFDEYRRTQDNEESLANLDWYKQVNGWPGDITINSQLLTITSNYFQIIAAGEFDTLSRSVVAAVQRSGENGVKLLGKKTE